MSYQLVISRAKTNGSSLGSTALPAELKSDIEQVFTARQGRLCDTDTPVYTYRTRHVGGAEYHILSRVCLSGDGQAEIIHSIILLPNELVELHTSTARPTPAGLTLALEGKSFWLDHMPESGDILNEEPKLTASALPDAATQDTWKRLTGHKGNARSFFTSPYDRECVLDMPPGMGTKDVLMLFHESDWLTASRGWGRTFTTCGKTGDNARDLQRIALPAGSPLAGSPEWGNLPVLTPDKELKLEEQHVVYPAPAPKANIAPAVESTPVPYEYVEADDTDAYPVQTRKLNRYQKLLLVVACLLVLAFTINFLVYENVDDAAALASKAIEQTTVPEKVIPAPKESAPQGKQQAPAKADEKDVQIPVNPFPATADTPAEPQSPGEPEQVQPAPQTKSEELLCRFAGEELPQGTDELLNGEGIRCTVFTLDGNGSTHFGLLKSVPGETGLLRCHPRNGNKGCDVRLERDGRVFRSATVNGKTAAILLRMPQGDFLLMPELVFPFGKSTSVALSDINFNIKPSQLGLNDKGELTCTGHPTINKGKPVYTENKVNIVLPLPKRIEDLKFDCYSPLDLPVTIEFGSVVARNATCSFSTKLILKNPFHKKFNSIFRDISQQALAGGKPGTCTELFTLAQNMERGQDVEGHLNRYRAMQQALAADFPELPDAGGSPVVNDLAWGIKEAICKRINRELNDRYRTAREKAESYSAPVRLSLEGFKEEKGTARWVFTLQEDKSAEK